MGCSSHCVIEIWWLHFYPVIMTTDVLIFFLCASRGWWNSKQTFFLVKEQHFITPASALKKHCELRNYFLEQKLPRCSAGQGGGGLAGSGDWPWKSLLFSMTQDPSWLKSMVLLLISWDSEVSRTLWFTLIAGWSVWEGVKIYWKLNSCFIVMLTDQAPKLTMSHFLPRAGTAAVPLE